MSDHAETPPRELLAAIAASSNDAIVGKDLNGTVTFWNEAAELLFGYTAAEMIGTSILRIVPPTRTQEEADILVKVRRGERLTHFETERQTRDGRVIPVSVTISPIRDNAGHIVGASKVARDLSETHRAAKELERRQALLQTILDIIPDGLIVINRAGIIQSFTHAAERIFGYAENEVIGRNVSVLMPGSDASSHNSYIGRYLDTGSARIIGIGRVVTGRRKDGSLFPMELQVGELKTSGAHLFTGFVRDLTQRYERDRRMAELQQELIHVSRLSELGQMVSALAHEISQPLTAIANYAGGMRRLLQSADFAFPVLGGRESVRAGRAYQRHRPKPARSRPQDSPPQTIRGPRHSDPRGNRTRICRQSRDSHAGDKGGP